MSKEPIVFVDGGVCLKVRFVPPSRHGGGDTPRRIADIDPISIERVEVLKGAAAATLYGTEASNDVIQILPKEGQSGAW